MTELQEWFDEYNRLYFRGRLEPCDVYFCQMETIGFCGKYDDGSFYIEVNQRIQWSSALWHMTLLHEMVHLKLYGKDMSPLDKHSRMFNREMKKLAARGAFVGLW